MKKRKWVRNHRPHKREDCATRAKAGGEASLDLGVTWSEREVPAESREHERRG